MVCCPTASPSHFCLPGSGHGLLGEPRLVRGASLNSPPESGGGRGWSAVPLRALRASASLVQDTDRSVSPGSRGELRLIPLLNQEGVGGGLLSEGWRAAAGRARTARFRVPRLDAAFAHLCTLCSRTKRERAPALQGPYPVP